MADIPVNLVIFYVVFVGIYFGIFGPLIASLDTGAPDANFTNVNVTANTTNITEWESQSTFDYLGSLIGYATSSQFLFLNVLLLTPGVLIFAMWIISTFKPAIFGGG